MCTRAGRIPPRARIAKASRQRRKRAEEAQENAKENAVRKSAATAEQGCGALASAAIEIIEHRALKPRRIPSRLRRERINFQRSLTELACANLSAARRRNARRMRPYPSVATTASVCARRGGMQGQFGTGTILIRRLEPQGEGHGLNQAQSLGFKCCGRSSLGAVWDRHNPDSQARTARRKVAGF